MRMVAEGIVVASNSDPARTSACFPNICRLPGGRIIVGYRAAAAKDAADETSRITWSDDNGATWSRPSEPFVAPSIGGRAGRFRALAPTALGGRRVLATLMWMDRSDMWRPMFNE